MTKLIIIIIPVNVTVCVRSQLISLVIFICITVINFLFWNQQSRIVSWVTTIFVSAMDISENGRRLRMIRCERTQAVRVPRMER